MNVPELPQPLSFEWDAGNQIKNLIKHNINTDEAEECFFNYKVIVPDPRHSKFEFRFGLYGQTNAGKILFIIFIIRDTQVRVISARSADKKERKIYEEAFKKTT